jgi:hypothetical protein
MKFETEDSRDIYNTRFEQTLCIKLESKLQLDYRLGLKKNFNRKLIIHPIMSIIYT